MKILYILTNIIIISASILEQDKCLNLDYNDLLKNNVLIRLLTNTTSKYTQENFDFRYCNFILNILFKDIKNLFETNDCVFKHKLNFEISLLCPKDKKIMKMMLVHSDNDWRVQESNLLFEIENAFKSFCCNLEYLQKIYQEQQIKKAEINLSRLIYIKEKYNDKRNLDYINYDLSNENINDSDTEMIEHTVFKTSNEMGCEMIYDEGKEIKPSFMKKHTENLKFNNSNIEFCKEKSTELKNVPEIKKFKINMINENLSYEKKNSDEDIQDVDSKNSCNIKYNQKLGEQFCKQSTNLHLLTNKDQPILCFKELFRLLKNTRFIIDYNLQIYEKSMLVILKNGFQHLLINFKIILQKSNKQNYQINKKYINCAYEECKKNIKENILLSKMRLFNCLYK